MLIKVTCETCYTEYEAEMIENRVVYIEGNKRIKLRSSDQDCESCIAEIEKAKEEAKQKIKATKNGTQHV